MAYPSSNFSPSNSLSENTHRHTAAAAAYAGGSRAAIGTHPVVTPATLSSASTTTALGVDVLTIACKTNDISKVLFAIQLGARPTSETLTWACLSKDPRIVDEVLNLGAKPDHATLNGACSTGNFMIVIKAIAANALPNPKTMEVVEKTNNIHIVNMVKHYIDLQAASVMQSGGVPQVTSVPGDKLSLACKTGNCALVQKAIREEAFPDDETLYWAIKSGDEEIVKLVIARGARSGRYDETHTESLLSFACELGHSDIIEQVMLAGSKPTKNTLLKLLPHLLRIRQHDERPYDYDGLEIGGKKEPYDTYFSRKFRSLAEIVLNTGPLPSTETLNIACKNNEEWIVLELLKLKVKPDKHTLIYAIEGYCLKAIAPLLASGASTEGAFKTVVGLIRKDPHDSENRSDCLAIFKTLIESGANMNEAIELLNSACKNPEEGDLALELLHIGVKADRNTLFSAIEGTCLDVVKKLLAMRLNKEGTLIFTLRLIKSMLGKAECAGRCNVLMTIFKTLIESGARMDDAGCKEATEILNLACKKSNDSVALELLHSGVTPNNSTLLLAVDGNCGFTVAALVRSGANTTDILNHMIRPNSNGYLFDSLLDLGVKGDSTTFKRAVDFACEHRDPDLMDRLCRHGYAPTSAEVRQLERTFGRDSRQLATMHVAYRKTISEPHAIFNHVKGEFMSLKK